MNFLLAVNCDSNDHPYRFPEIALFVKRLLVSILRAAHVLLKEVDKVYSLLWGGVYYRVEGRKSDESIVQSV
jgi:hypothetical protein